MSTIVKPRFVLLQSVTNKIQFFYLVLFDLPSDTRNYPNPSGINPELNGTSLVYKTDDYVLPEEYNGETITYLLKPFMIISEDESTPNIKSIVFEAKTTKKKGDTGGVLAKQIYSDPLPISIDNLDESNFYICKDRCFVIQSDTNLGTYFVGSLVDYPSDAVIGENLHLMDNNELQIERVDGTNPYKTFLGYTANPASYNPDTNPKSASYTACFVNGYGSDTHKGVLLSNEIDLYANPLQPEYGTV